MALRRFSFNSSVFRRVCIVVLDSKLVAEAEDREKKENGNVVEYRFRIIAGACVCIVSMLCIYQTKVDVGTANHR